MELQEKIKDAMQGFDSDVNMPLDELDIKAALRTIINGATPSEMNIQAELIAFTLFEGNNRDITGWSGYYSPEVFGMSDGTTYTLPSLDMITLDVVKYWESRAQECKHPVLLSRYLGLVWDFGRKVGFKPAMSIALTYVDMLLTSVENGLTIKPHLIFTKLERALTLAVAFKHRDFINRAIDAVLRYEKNIPDSKPGHWGFSYDLLMDNTYVTDEVKAGIVQELENRLERLSTGTDDKLPDPWASEKAASRLAKYYKKKNKPDDVERVITKYGDAYEARIAEAGGIQAYGWLETLYEIYSGYGLTEKAEAVLVRLASSGQSMQDEMGVVRTEVELPKIEIDNAIDSFLEHTSDEIFTGLGIQFIPSKEESEREMRDQARRSPMMYMFTKKSYDGGRLISTVGALEDDLDSNLVVHIAQTLELQSIFLNMTIRRGIEKGVINVQSLMDFISKSAVIAKDRLTIIHRGLEAYFAADYLVTAHLLIPQIEEGCRRIIQMNGGNTWKPSKYGGFNVSTFGMILEHELFIEAFDSDMSLYFTILFTDQRGWNLRNRIMHGLVNPKSFNEKICDRLIHAILLLAFVRHVNNGE